MRIARSTHKALVCFAIEPHALSPIFRASLTEQYDRRVIELADIRRAQALYQPQSVALHKGIRTAAVAVVFRQGLNGVEVLFIRRAERDGDPWSGQIAFPGGHVEPQDVSLRAAAQRETLEETGLSLEKVEFLGQMAPQQTSRRKASLNVCVVPHAFVIADDPELLPNHEVEEVIWVLLEGMSDESAWQRTELSWEGRIMSVEGLYLTEGYFVWGLTFRIIRTLLAELGGVPSSI